MNNKSKKFTFILAAIFIAAICVFPIFADGGANAHASAPAYEQEQPAQVLEPAVQAVATPDKEEIFSDSNDISATGNRLNAKSWVSGKTYDKFAYSLTVGLYSTYAEYTYDFMNDSGTKGISFGNFNESNGLEACFKVMGASGLVETTIDIGSASSSYQYLNIDLDDEKLEMYHTAMSGTELGKRYEALKGTANYEKIKNIIFSETLTLENFSSSASNTPDLSEYLALYKTVEVPPPVEYEKEYLLEESNVLHDGNTNNIGKGKKWLASVEDYDSYNYRIICEVNSTTTSNYVFTEGDADSQWEFSFGMNTNGGRYAGALIHKKGDSSTSTNVAIFNLSPNVHHIMLEINYVVGEDYEVKLKALRFNNEVENESTVLDGQQIFEGVLLDSDNFIYSTNNGLHDGKVIEEMTIFRNQTIGSSIPMPADPVKEGHTFIGWYYDEEFTRPYRNRPIYADTNLYAKFDIHRHTVNYKSDEETELETQTVDWGTVLNPETPTKRGYDFLGWFYEDGTEYAGQAIKENTTLIAHWQIKTFTVTFYVDGEIYSVKEVEYGTVFSKVVEEAATENLELLAVLEGESEKKIKNYLNTEITDNYSVRAIKTKLDPTAAQIFFGKYPWIFAVGGAALSLVVAGISIAGYFAQKHNRVQSTGRKKR